MDAFAQAILDIATAALRAFPKEDGDYIQSGLLYCGKCHTPKQCRVAKLNNAILPCACKCKQDEINRIMADEKTEASKRYVEHLRESAFRGQNLKNARFETAKNLPVIFIAKKYADEFDEMREMEKGLLLYGGTGVGKTYAAACIVNALVDKKVRCKFTNFARLFGETDWDNRQNEIDALNGFDLLVIDDLGAERDTETMAEFKWNVIDNRVGIGLPMVITTNMGIEDFKAANPKLMSRLYGSCYFHEVGGADRRKEEYRDTKNRIKKILGEE